jgi:chromosome partitioning protein
MLGLSFTGPPKDRTETEVRTATTQAPQAPAGPDDRAAEAPGGTTVAAPPAPAPAGPPAPEPAHAETARPPVDMIVDNNVADAPVVPMQVIVFTSQKGGSGKTTLCGHLAVAAEMSGNIRVALVDCDPQGSLADWWNARAAATPLFVGTTVTKLGETLEMLRMQGIDLVFIDTPPSVTDTIRDIVTHADLVVIPTRPSPHDLRAVGATLDIVDTEGKPLVFAVNGATRRAKITSDTAIALSQHGTVAPVTVHHRTDFATSMVQGGTVLEENATSKSAAEVAALWHYLFTRLRKVERRMVQRPFAGGERRDPNRGRAFGGAVPRVGAGFGRRVGD